MMDPDRRDGLSDDAAVDAALWALGLPEAAPRAASDALVAEVASLREAAALLVLGLDAVAPDARVWPRLERALATATEAAPAAAAPVDALAARRRARVAYAIATLGLASAAALTVLWLEARRDAADVHARVDGIEVVRSPDLALSTVRGNGGGVAQILTADGGRRWLVIALDLPAVPEHDYQLWFVPEIGPPVSAGLLHLAADGSLDATATVPSTIGRVRPAISLEPSGGSVSPTTVKMLGEII